MSFLSQPVTLSAIFGARRTIGPLEVQVVSSEETNDTLTITKQPVQQGANITDHAFQEPTVLSMNIYQQQNGFITGLVDTFTGGGLAQIYQQFLDLQASRQPFDIVTPKRIYKSMLINVLRCNTDKRTENILSLSLSFQQVIIVSVGTVQVPPTRQKKPASTQATQNAGKKSAALSLTQGIFPNTVGFSQ